VGDRTVIRDPASIAVVGAGIVGLATAWFLQEHGKHVTLLEAGQVGAGASWGNAGWLTPTLATPLPEPSLLRFGLRAILGPSSPVHIPLQPDAQLFRFLGRFVRQCTTSRWEAAMHCLVPLNRESIAAYDRLRKGGVAGPMIKADPFMAAFRTTRQRDVMLKKIEHIQHAGQDVEFEILSSAEARDLEPCLSAQIRAGVRLLGQRYVDPGEFVHSLAQSVRDRGARIEEHAEVVAIHSDPGSVSLETTNSLPAADFDCVVVAAGARLGKLADSFGLGLGVQAGRGYSFSVPVTHQPRGPIYFPHERIACLPWQGRLRITGMMEFCRPEEPLNVRRLDTVARAAAPVLRGVRMSERQHEWVGSRPCTWDGLPLVGRTRSPRVFVATGHGMFGMTQGPVTGLLLAEEIATGRRVDELVPLSPLR
jgi:D-amino-acid dehydrogenase